MDINKQINEIIIKYNIDSMYPGFRKYEKAKDLIGRLASELKKDRVLCVGCEKAELDRFKIFFNHPDTTYVNCAERSWIDSTAEVGWDDAYQSSFDLTPLLRFDRLSDYKIIIIHRGALKILDYLSDSGCMTIDLYDYFELNGLVVEQNYCNIFYVGGWNISLMERSFHQIDGVTLEIRNCIIKLNLTRETIQKEHLFKKLYFLALYERNFVFAERCLKSLRSINPNVDDSYEYAWEEIQNVLSELSRAIKLRNKRDVIGLWIDDVSHNESKYIDFFEEIKKVGIWFERAYTCTPFTNPTYRLLFTGKKVVDDESFLIGEIDESNSRLIKTLYENGYDYRCVGEYFGSLSDEYKTESYHSMNTPCSKMIWDTLDTIINSPKPIFVLTHIAQESHLPCWSTDMGYAVHQRKRMGLNEISEQLRWYSKYINDESIYVLFSDHGSGLDINDSEFHSFFSVYKKGIHSRIIEDIFSYEDFGDLILELIEHGDIIEKKYEREYMCIQDLCLYNRERIINKFLKAEVLDAVDLMGYNGIVGKEYTYIKLSNGEEWFGSSNQSMLMNIEWVMPPIDCNNPYYKRYKDVVEEKEKEASQAVLDKTKYFRYLEMVIKESTPAFMKKINLLRGLFESLQGKTIAIRNGGPHTRHLLNYFSEELENVKYIIDIKPEGCMFYDSKFEIIKPTEIRQKRIDCIIISTKKSRAEILKECEKYPENILIIDIYGFLEEHGINEDREFFFMHPSREDFIKGYTRMKKEVG